MLRGWLRLLDRIGMDDPDANEGFPEDRCPVCEWPMIDHPDRGGRAARWPHRRAVLAGIIIGRI